MATRSPVVNHDSLVLTLLPEAVSADGYEVRRLYVGIGTHEILRAVAPAALILDTPRDKPAAIWQLRGIVRGDAAMRRWTPSPASSASSATRCAPTPPPSRGPAP